MKLNDKEMQLIRNLRSMPTCKVTVVKYNGLIKAMRVEMDLELQAKAQAEIAPRGTFSGAETEKSLGGPKVEQRPLGVGEVRTREAGTQGAA